ncbi:MAG: hypothetical protein ABIK15_07325 [Pseudomonadota bacterium]
MPDEKRLRFEDGQVSLGGKIIPGILMNQSVRGQVRFDKTEQEGAGSGKVKVAMGWEDADVCLQVDLLTDDDGTCYEKLTDLNAVFVGADNKARPQVYTVVNPHLMARGIRQVVFSGLDSSETDTEDIISCNLAFTEEKPAIVESEKRVTAGSKAVTTSTKNPDPDPAIMVDVG